MRQTFRDAVADYFKAHPGEWIDGDVFRPIGGKYAYRTRISDCRTELGMVIENRVRACEDARGDIFRLSEYRYLPPSAPIQQGLPVESNGQEVQA